MLVPRSFKYSSSPPSHPSSPKLNDSRSKSQSGRLYSVSSDPPRSSTPLAVSPPASASSLYNPMSMRQPSKPVEIPSTPSARPRKQHVPRKSQRSQDTTTHRSEALPPAVAALLAVTAIPPPWSSQPRRKRASPHTRQMSIDELVQEWRNDASLKSSFGSSASLSLLLESSDEPADERSSYSRSSSCGSVPSLEGDDNSVMSMGSPATPGSIRSRRSTTTTTTTPTPTSRKEKHFSSIETEDCGVEHPLGISAMFPDDDQDFMLAVPAPKSKNTNGRKSSSFKSNLTSSLQALKSRALSSISSLEKAITQTDAAFSDESLWQHPYLFPRLSSEVRPRTFTSPPTSSQRRYLNRALMPFEEQQHHWSRALCTIDDEELDSPMIQMQTYRRSVPSNGRKPRRNSGTSDSRSEAGRALAGAPQLGRQREVRENSNFLRVIVLEMNMRRKGKLEEGTAGKARIWLPPRRVVIPNEDVFDDEEEEGDEENLAGSPVGRRIPKRWIGLNANY